MDTLLVGNFDETHTGLVQLAAPYLPSYGPAAEVLFPPPFFLPGLELAQRLRKDVLRGRGSSGRSVLLSLKRWLNETD
jgi:hypothetical protein